MKIKAALLVIVKEITKAELTIDKDNWRLNFRLLLGNFMNSYIMIFIQRRIA